MGGKVSSIGNDRSSGTKQLQQGRSKLSSLSANMKSIFGSQNALGSVVSSTLIYHWIIRATANASLLNYYEKMYGIETYQRGYLSSYQRILSLVFHSFFVQTILKCAGGERSAVCLSSLLMACAAFLEIKGSLPLLITITSPVTSFSSSMLGLSLRSLVTQVAPEEAMGSVLAALDVLINATAVTVPFYRTLLFRLLVSHESENYDEGDSNPSPILWQKCSAVHWLLATVILSALLLRKANTSRNDNIGKKKK